MGADRFQPVFGRGRGPAQRPTFSAGTMSPGDRAELARLTAQLSAASYGETVEILRAHGSQLRAPFPGLRRLDQPPFTEPRVGLVDAVNDALTAHVLENLLEASGYGSALRSFSQQLGGDVALRLLEPHLSTEHLPGFPLDYCIAQGIGDADPADPTPFVERLRHGGAQQTVLAALSRAADAPEGEQLVEAIAGPTYIWMRTAAHEVTGSAAVAPYLARIIDWGAPLIDLLPQNASPSRISADALAQAREALQTRVIAHIEQQRR